VPKKRRSKLNVDSVASEFVDTKVADPRVASRLMRVAELCSKAPDWSFPDQMQTTADLEAFYRLVGNPNLTSSAIGEAHFEKTAQRASELELVLVPCDETEFVFKGRQNMGYLGPGREGFLLHAALAISPGKARLPLGVVDAVTWKRAGKKTVKHGTAAYHKTKESLVWKETVERVCRRVPDPDRLLFISDREADDFDYLAYMHQHGRRHVTRMAHDRVVIGYEGEPCQTYMSDALSRAPVVFNVEVTVSARKGKAWPDPLKHPPRDKRAATVSVRAARLTLKKSQDMPLHVASGIHSIEINVVRVSELDPPEDQEPIEWVLSTTEPIDTAVDLQRVVEYYRARWVIEEFFRAVKSGCRYEQRQLESYETLTRALMIFLPVAWRLLLLRSAARECPNEPASAVLEPDHVAVLRAHAALAREPTIKEALDAVARLGGHIRQNGLPGWVVLGRGFVKLDQMAFGWALAKASS
jgi:hypothetical protein